MIKGASGDELLHDPQPPQVVTHGHARKKDVARSWQVRPNIVAGDVVSTTIPRHLSVVMRDVRALLWALCLLTHPFHSGVCLVARSAIIDKLRQDRYQSASSELMIGNG